MPRRGEAMAAADTNVRAVRCAGAGCVFLQCSGRFPTTRSRGSATLPLRSPRGGTRFCASAGAWRARRRAHRKLVTRLSSLVSGAPAGRGWKPHLRKWRGSSSTSRAGLPEVRHLAAPWRGHGRGRQAAPQTRHSSLVTRHWRTRRARLEAAPPEVARKFIHKSGGASGGAASCRAGGHGAPEGAPAASCHFSLFTRHWRARRARRPTAPEPSAPCGGRAACRTGRGCTPRSRRPCPCRKR